MKKITEKQALEVTATYFVWDGFQYLLMWDIMLQTEGRLLHMVETTHMTGSINGRRFISTDERKMLIDQTREHLNS